MPPDSASRTGNWPGHLAPRDHRARGSGSHREVARQRLHPVPLPRGGGEPADDRRDRPRREDPRVQVLRGQGRARRWLSPASASPASGQGREVPRPVADPGAQRDPGASRLAARAELVGLSHDVRPPLYEIEGLICSTALPERAACQGRAAGLPRPVLLAARRRGADRRAPRPVRRGPRRHPDRGLLPGRCHLAPACTVNEAPHPMPPLTVPSGRPRGERGKRPSR